MNRTKSVYMSNDEDIYSSIKIYKDYTILMYKANQSAKIFYNRVKISLSILNIVLSALSTAINSAYINTPYDKNKIDNKTLGGLNIIIKSSMVINFVLCINMGILYLFEIAQKETFFKIYADNYLRLYNTIEQQLSLKKNIDNNFATFILFEYAFLNENAKYDIPVFLKKKIKKEYNYSHNIPIYLDVYIHDFTITNYVKKIIDIYNVLKSKKLSNSKLNEYSNASNLDYSSNYRLSNIIVHNVENSNISAMKYNYNTEVYQNHIFT